MPSSSKKMKRCRKGSRRIAGECRKPCEKPYRRSPKTHQCKLSNKAMKKNLSRRKRRTSGGVAWTI